jgi:hypothetical protein
VPHIQRVRLSRTAESAEQRAIGRQASSEDIDQKSDSQTHYETKKQAYYLHGAPSSDVVMLPQY